MLFFKHAELAAQYHVSLKTVHNWIDEARQDKINLELYLHNGRTYVANNPSNIATLDRLVEERKKYRNTLHHKVVHPVTEFYDLFSRVQILDIINSLNVHKEIPLQYGYIGPGAINWDQHEEVMTGQKNYASSLAAQTLINTNLSTIDTLIDGYDRVNVVDIGVGNAGPMKDFLGHLLKKGVLGRYIGLDISQSMLDMAKSNLLATFGDKFPFEGYVRDITRQHFDDLLVDDMLDEKGSKTINLAFLLGGTLLNFREPSDALNMICSSLGQQDLLCYTCKPDSPKTRYTFSFSTPSGKLIPLFGHMIDLLGIDRNLYEIEMGFNPAKSMRYVQIRFNTTVTLEFTFKAGKRRIEFQKGDTLLVWRFWHYSPITLVNNFENVGFQLRHCTLTKDQQNLLAIMGVKSITDATV